MATDILWPLAIIVASAAAWDFGRRYVAYKRGYKHDLDSFRAEVQRSIDENEDKRKQAVTNLAREMDEIKDEMRNDYAAFVNKVTTAKGLKPAGDMAPWQANKRG